MASQFRIDDRYDVAGDVVPGLLDRMYKAHDRSSGREVVLRLLSSGNALTQMGVARDLELYASLNHPNILSVFDIGETTLNGEQVIYIVMPFLPGRSLAEVMQQHRGPIALRLAIDIAHQMGNALDALHSHHLIHRDLTPQKVLLSDSGIVHLTDFGLARVVSGKDAVDSYSSLPYMAPELVAGSHMISAAADIYSLALIFYELVTGAQPFAKPTHSETLVAILHDPIPRAGIFNPYVKSQLESVLTRALSKEPERRYWSARAFCDDLSAAVNAELVEPDEAEVQTVPNTQSGQWRIVLAADLQDLDSDSIERLIEELRRLSGEQTLRLVSIEHGSVILILEGSDDGFKVIDHLVRTGNLTEVLGLKIQSVDFEPNDTRREPTKATEQSSTTADQTRCTVFISYSHKDDKLRHSLSNHLRPLERQGLIDQWHDRKITAGQEWKGEIDQRMESSQMILLLVSPDFVASQYCYDNEMKRALERHERKESRVVPIILRPVDWHQSPFGKLQALPRDGKAVTLWTNRDEAFSAIAQDLRQAASEIRAGVY
jgi:serine/threonine protein kinase